MLEAIDRQDLYGQVAYPKHHSRSQVPAIYRWAAARRGVFVNPALTEPFGLTLIEAAACGLPVVATNDGGPIDILGRCRNGLLVDVSSREALRTTLEKALAADASWDQWRQQGLEAVQQAYSWEAHASRYLKVARPLCAAAQLESTANLKANSLRGRVSAPTRLRPSSTRWPKPRPCAAWAALLAYQTAVVRSRAQPRPLRPLGSERVPLLVAPASTTSAGGRSCAGDAGDWRVPARPAGCSSNSLRFCPRRVTRPVSCGRGDNSEKITSPEAIKNSRQKCRLRQGISHLTGHALGLQELTLLQFCWLPAALVVASFLDMADRRAEQSWPFLLAHCQQGDLLLETQKFLNDDQAGAASCALGGSCPGLLKFLRVGGHALAFAR